MEFYLKIVQVQVTLQHHPRPLPHVQVVQAIPDRVIVSS